jgi:hypothetical protein
MRNAIRSRFPLPLNDAALRTAIESICAKYGKVANLKIFPANNDRPPCCICFLRLDSPEAESRLMRNLDAIRSGQDVLFTADVAEGWSGPRM